jgi:hypothetical protein
MVWIVKNKEDQASEDRTQTNKFIFLWSLPGDTQAEKAEFLGIRQAALSLWVKRSSTIRREAILLAGWPMLTDEQRARAMGE